MSVLNTEYKDSYVGRTDTGPYAITFDVVLDDGGDAMDIVVKLLDSNDVETDITSSCTISGKNVYTSLAYGITYTVVLVRYPDLTQPYTFPFGTKFPSRTFEKAIDRLLYLAQRLALESDQSLKVPISEVAPLRIPSLGIRANQYAAYDADGNPIAAANPGAYPATPFMATVLDDLSAAAALTTLGFSAFIRTLIDDADKIESMATLGRGTVVLSTGSPYTLVAHSYESFIINATTNPYIVNLPQASSCVGYRLKIVNGSADATGLIEIVPYSGDAIGKLAADVKVYLQNVDQSGMAFLYQHLELIATVSGEWAVLGGQFCPAQGVDTNGQQYHLGKLHHLPLGNATSRNSPFSAVLPGATSWYGLTTATGVNGVPAGAKAIRAKVYLQLYSTAAGACAVDLYFSDNSSYTPTRSTAHPGMYLSFVAAAAAAQPIIMCEMDIPLNSSGQFNFYQNLSTNNTNGNSRVGVHVVGYYMGD